MLTMLLVFQTLIGPLSAFGTVFAAGTPQEDLELSFVHLDYNGTLIKSTADANAVKPQAGDSVKLRYEFSTSDELEFEDGDTFQFNLPDSFLVFDKQSLQGNVSFSGVKYFEYSVDENKLVTVTAKDMFQVESQMAGLSFQLNLATLQQKTWNKN